MQRHLLRKLRFHSNQCIMLEILHKLLFMSDLKISCYCQQYDLIGMRDCGCYCIVRVARGRSGHMLNSYSLKPMRTVHTGEINNHHHRFSVHRRSFVELQLQLRELRLVWMVWNIGGRWVPVVHCFNSSVRHGYRIQSFFSMRDVLEKEEFYCLK